MRTALWSSAWALGVVAVMAAGCKRNPERVKGDRTNEPRGGTPSAMEGPRAQEPQGRTENKEPRSIGGGPAEPMKKITVTSAVANIAAARCDREVRCKNVGPKEHYASRAECVSIMEADKQQSLAQDCPAGIKEDELNKCLKDIREEGCNDPLDAINRLSACRSGNLCSK
jgi:hypothetical protein